jgi:UrcA family protein
MNTITKIIVATAIAAAAGPMSVRYADLDLNRQAGQDRLARRIHKAAEMACGGDESTRDLAAQQGFKHCYTAAVDRAKLAINVKRNPAVALGTE